MNKKDVVKEFAYITLAVFIIATAVYFFLIPSRTAISSISGLAIVLSQLTPFSVSVITFVFNAVLLVVGFFVCGSEFGIKTVYTSLMLPVFMGMYEVIIPNSESLTGDQIVDVVAYIIIVSFGLAMLFNRNASSGGIDIIAMVMNKFLHIEVGKAMSIAGICVSLSAWLVYDAKSVALSILGTYFNGLAIDYFIFGQNEKKRVCILTKKEEEVRNFILHDLHSGATIYEAKGAYNMKVHNEIIVIVDKKEYQKLMTYINATDPDAFMTVYTVKEVKYKPKVRG